MVEPIIIKSNYPKVGIVTIEYGIKVTSMSAKDYNDITNTLSSNSQLRTKIKNLQW